MRAPAEYRAQAAECMRKAEHAKNANHRMTLFDMAQTWLRMADEAELISKKLSDDRTVPVMLQGTGTPRSQTSETL